MERPELTDVARLVVDLANGARAQEKLGAAAVNGRLEQAARDYARYLAKTGRFSHGADGATPASRARRAGYDYCVISENLAYQFSSTDFATRELAQLFLESWQKSPGHRRNLLDPDVTETGVAVARGKPGEYYAVQMFGRPSSQSIRFSVANRSNAAVRYRVGDKGYSLAPREKRTHTQCRPEDASFEWPGRQAATALTPKGGAAYAVVRSEGGRFGLEPE